MTLSKHSYALGLVAALFTLVADQASKWWVVSGLLHPERPFIEVFSFFRIVMVWNRGISFGMFSALNQPIMLVGISLVVVGILLVWLHKNTSPLLALALGL
ncbi:MAG: signal peptidase II, partial [Alphaproteobacteria bacterium]|nr:signal peptidase II [Alphaproteobacteria bacterium]